MRETGNDNLIWHLPSRSLGKYAFELKKTVDFNRVGTRKLILQGKNETISSACESVYRDIPVPHCETVRLPLKL